MPFRGTHRSDRITRRGALAGSLALVATGASAAGRGFQLRADDMALGDPAAKVTVVEYASLGCPHCGHWANEVFAPFKAKYVDTGKVRFVLRECLTGEPTVAAAGFLLARCAGPAKYFAVAEAVYRDQEIMFNGEDTPRNVLQRIAAANGLDAAKFDACLTDRAGQVALNARNQRSVDVDKVESTPTFLIGEKRIVGFATLDELGAAIAAASRRR
ncbi:MAG: thioredoxin domain-containing protein [Caulobacterales bacterium]